MPRLPGPTAEPVGALGAPPERVSLRPDGCELLTQKRDLALGTHEGVHFVMPGDFLVLLRR